MGETNPAGRLRRGRKKREEMEYVPRKRRKYSKKLSTASSNQEPEAKRRKKNNHAINERRQSVLVKSCTENVERILDFKSKLAEDSHKTEGNSLSRMLKITLKEFLTTDDVLFSMIPFHNQIAELHLGRFFFASTDSDVRDLKRDFESAGYFCHLPNQDLILYKLFRKNLPNFEDNQVISVFSTQNIKLRDLSQLKRVSKYTRALTFSKEAFLVFKTESDSRRYLESFSEDVRHETIEKCQHMGSLQTSSTILNLKQEGLGKTEDVSKRLILYSEQNLEHLDSRLFVKLVLRIFGLAVARVESHQMGGKTEPNLVSLEFVSERDALAAFKSWRVLNIFGTTWSILQAGSVIDQRTEEREILVTKAHETKGHNSGEEDQTSSIERKKHVSQGEKEAKNEDALEDLSDGVPDKSDKEFNTDATSVRDHIEGFMVKNKALVDQVLTHKQEESPLRDSNEKCQIPKDLDRERDETMSKLRLAVKDLENELEEAKKVNKKSLEERETRVNHEKEALLLQVDSLKKENGNLLSHDQILSEIYNRTALELEQQREKVKELQKMNTTIRNESKKQEKIKINLIPPCRTQKEETSGTTEKAIQTSEDFKNIDTLEKIIKNNAKSMIIKDERNSILTQENLKLKGLTEKNRQLGLQLSERDFDINELEKRLEEKNSELEHFKAQNFPGQASSEVERLLRDENKKCQQELGQYVMESTKLKMENKKQRKIIEENEKEKEKLSKRLRRKKEDLEQSETESLKLEKEKGKLQKENEKLESQVKSMEQDYKSLSSYIQELELQREHFEREREQIELQKQELQNTVKSLKLAGACGFKTSNVKEKTIVQSIMVNEKNHTMKEVTQRLEKEKQYLIKTCNKLRQDLKQETQRAESFEKESRKANERLSTQIEKLLGEKIELEKNIETRDKDTETLKHKTASLQSEIEKIREEQEELKRQSQLRTLERSGESDGKEKSDTAAEKLVTQQSTSPNQPRPDRTQTSSSEVEDQPTSSKSIQLSAGPQSCQINSPEAAETSQSNISPTLRLRPVSEMKEPEDTLRNFERELLEWLTEEKAKRSDAEIIQIRGKLIAKLRKSRVEKATSDPHKQELMMKKMKGIVNSVYRQVFPSLSPLPPPPQQQALLWQQQQEQSQLQQYQTNNFSYPGQYQAPAQQVSVQLRHYNLQGSNQMSYPGHFQPNVTLGRGNSITSDRFPLEQIEAILLDQN